MAAFLWCLAFVLMVAPLLVLWLTRPLSVKSCGATGDAETDDTEAIRRAFAKAGRWRRPYFPPGTYRVSGRIPR